MIAGGVKRPSMLWVVIPCALCTPPAAAQQKPTPPSVAADACNTPDPGFGHYHPWDHGLGIGHALVPQSGGITADGGFDLVVHFHGHEAARKELVHSGAAIVLVGVDLGTSSQPYSDGFAAERTFTDLLRGVETLVAKKRGLARAHVRRIGLSSWSAGFGAIGQILRQPVGKKVDTVILLDSLYAGYADADSKGPLPTHVEPFLKFAENASRGVTQTFQSYSQVKTQGYASTAMVSKYMVDKIGGRLAKVKLTGRSGMVLSERFDQKGYHVRGFDGEDKLDHCAHLGLLRDVVKQYLLPRWKTPPAPRVKK
jgi:hypothetical protein